MKNKNFKMRKQEDERRRKKKYFLFSSISSFFVLILIFISSFLSLTRSFFSFMLQHTYSLCSLLPYSHVDLTFDFFSPSISSCFCSLILFLFFSCSVTEAFYLNIPLQFLPDDRCKKIIHFFLFFFSLFCRRLLLVFLLQLILSKILNFFVIFLIFFSDTFHFMQVQVHSEICFNFFFSKGFLTENFKQNLKIYEIYGVKIPYVNSINVKNF